MGKPGLLYPAQALEQRMLDQVKNERGPDMNQAVHRIIYQLHFVHITKIGKISARRASFDTFSALPITTKQAIAIFTMC
jgi:hypothetical protein